MKSRTRADKIANLEILILSSAFSQAEAERTQAWLQTPKATSPNIRRAIFRGLERRLAIEEGRREVSIRDKADSLSRRIEYQIDKGDLT